MDLILTDIKGNEIRQLKYDSADFDLADTLDFEVVIALSDWQDDIKDGCRIFCPDTEYGGIVKEIETDTANQTITVKGYTWRGYLEKRIVQSTKTEAYQYLKGEANAAIRGLIDGLYDGIIKGATSTSDCILTLYQINRFATVQSALIKALKTQNYRLEIKYKQGQQGQVGYCEVGAVPIVDYSSQIELSQDSKLNFVMNVKNNGVNHLIALGGGELTDRTIIHLYLQKNGTIGKTQYYFGIDEIAEVYDSNSDDDLEKNAIEHFEELLSTPSLTMDVESLGIKVGIGDILGGRDYITGNAIKKALQGVIVTDSDRFTIEYRLEE